MHRAPLHQRLSRNVHPPRGESGHITKVKTRANRDLTPDGASNTPHLPHVPRDPHNSPLGGAICHPILHTDHPRGQGSASLRSRHRLGMLSETMEFKTDWLTLSDVPAPTIAYLNTDLAKTVLVVTRLPEDTAV